MSKTSSCIAALKVVYTLWKQRGILGGWLICFTPLIWNQSDKASVGEFHHGRCSVPEAIHFISGGTNFHC